MSSLPLPWVKPPPWIHTITGRPAAPARGVHTSRVRQSSLVPGMGMVPTAPSWGQKAPFLVASAVPFHAAAGAGGFHRSGPTGGAA